MPIETVDIKRVKVQREASAAQAKKTQQVEDRRDTKFRIKAMKTPMNKSACYSTPHPEYQCSEFRLAPSLMLIESVARMVPQIAPADYQRLKMRLLKSPDIAYLTENCFMNYEVQSDKLKLLLTIITHVANEILCTVTERNRENKIMEPTQEAKQQLTKKE